MRRRAEKVASRALFTPSEDKNERGKNAGYEAEMRIFYPHSCRKVKRIYRKRMEKVDEFQNILREKYRINKIQQNKILAYNTFIISSLLDNSP